MNSMAVTADASPDFTAVARERFPDVRGHLDAATAGVPPLAAVRAARAAIADWEQGRIDARRLDADVERSREAFARILGVAAGEIACGSQVSVFAGLVAASVPSGGEILTVAGDFTSVLFPMLAQEARGVRVREVELDRVPEAIDARTALVAVSAVQSADGRIADLDRLAAAAAHHGAEVFLDVTQAAGWLPIDGARFTYVCAGAYKWLLSPRGTALMRVAPAATERVVAHTAGLVRGGRSVGSLLRRPAPAAEHRQAVRRLPRLDVLGRDRAGARADRRARAVADRRL